jgi:hypothetical protein
MGLTFFNVWPFFLWKPEKIHEIGGMAAFGEVIVLFPVILLDCFLSFLLYLRKEKNPPREILAAFSFDGGFSGSIIGG